MGSAPSPPNTPRASQSCLWTLRLVVLVVLVPELVVEGLLLAV
jgi:hypothetical protein